MLDMRFLIPVVYSALTVCNNAGQIYQNAPDFPFCENYCEIQEVREKSISDNIKWSSDVVAGIYIPGFDVNSDGKFDICDVAKVKLSRENQALEKEKAERLILEAKAAEEARLKEEAEKAAAIAAAEAERAAKEKAEKEKAAEAQKAAETQKEQPAQTTEAAPEPPAENVAVNGIDVSKWQGRIDWNKIKAAGVEFAIIKAGEGMEIESRFLENITNAKAAGMKCGVYWFSKAHSPEEAKLEAEACLNAIAGYQLEYPIVYDCEYRSLEENPLENDKKALTDTVLTFLDTVQEHGYYSMLYTNNDFSDRFLEFDRIKDIYDIWFAGYKVDKPSMDCGMWQHSEEGTMDGLDLDRLNGKLTHVDLDIAYKDYPQIMKYLHLNGY